MTELEQMTEIAEGHKRAYQASRKAFDMLSDQQLHDFRCALLSSGFCNHLHSSRLFTSTVEEIAQAMLKIARGES